MEVICQSVINYVKCCTDDVIYAKLFLSILKCNYMLIFFIKCLTTKRRKIELAKYVEFFFF